MSQIRPHHSFIEFSKNAKKFSIHADVAKYSTESAKKTGAVIPKTFSNHAKIQNQTEI